MRPERMLLGFGGEATFEYDNGPRQAERVLGKC